MQLKQFLPIFICLLVSFSLSAQKGSLNGSWKTIDDETGDAKSYVEIYSAGSQIQAKVTKLLLKPADTVCKNCSGNKKNKPVVGMVIVDGLKAYKDYWRGGTILDPESGNEYKVSMWFEDGKTDELKVRGKHWTGLYRTQTWYRVK